MEIKAGLEFIEKDKNDKGVLALSLLSSYIPAQTGKKVYFGHQHQTPNYQEKLTRAVNFYSGKFSLKEAEKFLKENKIELVVYSEEEKELGSLNYPFLKSIFQNEKMEIFSQEDPAEEN